MINTVASPAVEPLIETRSRSWRRAAMVPGFAGVLVVTACGAGGSTTAASSAPNSPGTSIGNTATAAPGCADHQDPNAPVVKAPDGSVQFTFDSLCSDLGKGGSNVINVYPGPGADATTPNGTFMSGQHAYAQCKVEDGRPVSSIPGEGEAPAQSNAFLHLAGANSRYFATAVYVENRVAVLGALKPC